MESNCKKTVNKYWQNEIITSPAFYSTLEFLNMKSYKLGTIHPPLKINIHSARESSKLKIVSEYDQEIPQSQTADNPVAPQGRATQPSRDTRKTN